MLTFTTIFLGLVAGPQAIELAAPAGVARVELAVDGAPCATLTAPPWRAQCDFGPVPEPRRLTAAAFDGEGREVDRAERTVNLFRAPAEVAIHLERTAAGELRARLVAGSLTGTPPRAIQVELDGAALPAPDPVAAEMPAIYLPVIDLPGIDMNQPHLLRAELDWSDEVTAVGEVVFGGRYGDSIATELTAVAIESERQPTLAELDAALATPAGAARVRALDRGPAELFVVVDPDAIRPLARVSVLEARVPIGGSNPGRPGGAQTRALSAAQQRFAYSLEPGDRLRILWPWPETKRIDGRDHALFPPSPPFTSKDGGLAWLVVRAPLPDSYRQPPRLVEAAAVAGMIAAGRERRRAVLVLLDGGDDDASRLAPPALRAYLAAVRVPLFVWRLQKRKSQTPDPWGDVATLSSTMRFQSAFRELERALARQRIVWIEGSHLPNEVRIAAPGGAIRLAGAGAR